MVKKNEPPVPKAEKKPDAKPPKKSRPMNNPIASFLNELMNKPIEVKTKKGEFITGVLRGFDNHVNLIIEKQTAPGQNGSIRILIRGDSIETVRPR